MTVNELEVTVRQHDGVPVIDLVGDVNSSAESALDMGYEEASAGGGDIALNFTDVDIVPDSRSAGRWTALGRAQRLTERPGRE